MSKRTKRSKQWHTTTRKQVLEKVEEFARRCYQRGFGNRHDANRNPEFDPQQDERRNAYHFNICGPTFRMHIQVCQQTRVGLVGVGIYPNLARRTWTPDYNKWDIVEVDPTEVRMYANIYPELLPEFLERAPELVQIIPDEEG